MYTPTWTVRQLIVVLLSVVTVFLTTSLTTTATSLDACVPLSRGMSSTATSGAANVVELLLPVVIVSSPEVADMTAHLIYSMLLAETSVELPSSCSRSNNGTDAVTSFVVRPCILVVSGPRIGLLQQQQKGTSAGNAYHLALQRKMRTLTDIVVQSYSLMMMSGKKEHSMMLKRLLFIDSDSQVFDGWLRDLIVSRLDDLSRGDVIMPTTAISGGRDDAAVTTMNRLAMSCFFESKNKNKNKNKKRKKMMMHFQREAAGRPGTTHDKINTGVVLVDTTSEVAVAVFLRANATVELRKGGDQTAMQRTLRWYVDSNKVDQLLSAVQTTHALLLPLPPSKRRTTHNGHHEEEEEEVCDYAVFPKSEVNAGQVTWQRESLKLHHAHMSGKFKRKNLREVFAFKYRKNTSSSFSPVFLDASTSAVCHHRAGADRLILETCRVLGVPAQHGDRTLVQISTATTFTATTASTLPRDTVPSPQESTTNEFQSLSMQLIVLALAVVVVLKRCRVF